MYFTSDADIEHIARGFLNRSLPKSEWTHAAHFAAAVWMLISDETDALRDVPTHIRAYNEATGVPNTDTDGYHETITLASLSAAQHMLECAQIPYRPVEIVNGIMASAYGRSDWLFAYWSKACLFSVDARRRWLDPDLKPLPFLVRHKGRTD